MIIKPLKITWKVVSWAPAIKITIGADKLKSIIIDLLDDIDWDRAAKLFHTSVGETMATMIVDRIKKEIHDQIIEE